MEMGLREGSGQVVKTIGRIIRKTVKGSHVSRKGSPEDEAQLIQADGNGVFKLKIEVEKA